MRAPRASAHQAQPGQRPSHFGLSRPHSEQAKEVRAALALLTAIARIMAHHSSADNAEITLGSGLTEVRLVVLAFWIAKYSRIAIHAGAATPVISQPC